MKSIKQKIHGGIAAAALLLASVGYSQQVSITNIINTFDAAPSSGNGIGNEWGTGNWAWDADNGNPPGAAEYTATWDASSDTPLVGFACEPGGNPWYVNSPINCSAYQTLEFDIKYDNTSDISISQFNDVSTWPASMTNNASAGQSVFYSWSAGGSALVADGATTGLEIDLCGGPGGQQAPEIAYINIPDDASNGWAHVVIHINQAQSDIDGVSGIVFHKWCKDTWNLQADVSARFWIDNVELIGSAAPPAPPTLVPPVPVVQGLNIFSSSEGNSYYDRQEVELIQNSGLGWVGQATPDNPVTYSFSIVGYPNSYNCEAYLFLIPNPTATENAPDWNETNAFVFYIQGNTSTASAHIQYKVNDANGNGMSGGAAPYTNAPGSWDGVTSPWYESGNLLNSNVDTTVLGTWQLKFTSDTNVTVISPNGNTTSVVIPPYYASYFNASTMNVYLGMQANNADAMNQSVVYGNFSVSGNASPVSDNFLADSSYTNIWNSTVGTAPSGVFIPRPGSAYIVKWTLPDTGFSLETSSTLTDPLAWTSPSMGPTFPLYGYEAQVINSSELPAGNTVFFRDVQRVATKLQVLLPGETNAPNTVSGKIGTPNPIPAGDEIVNVTVNSVDDNWNIVSTSDTVAVDTSDDGNAVRANDAALSQGTGTFTEEIGVVNDDTGETWSFTASDVSNTNIVSGTSTSFTTN